jgi:hypothetical protein
MESVNELKEMTMADSENHRTPKKNVNWLIEIPALPKLAKLAADDKRYPGDEVSYLIEKEFEVRFSRQPDGTIVSELAHK